MGVGLAVLGLVLTAALQSRVPVLLAVLGLGVFSGAAAASREIATLQAELPRGVGTLTGVVLSDSEPFGSEARFVVRPNWWTQDGTTVVWHGPALIVVAEPGLIQAGDRVQVTGLIRPSPGFVRGDPVAGRVRARRIELVGTANSLPMSLGNKVRDRVRNRLEAIGPSPTASLLSGFLIGDTGGLPESDVEALQRAGLTHFVAVSGSNVALVLGAWWLILGPLGASPALRASSGLFVLLVFVVATRWESSVIRAATMAFVVLGGRAFGFAIDGWVALGAAVTVLLAASGDLAADVGFQLSVAATAGVLAGFGLFGQRRPRPFWAALGATVSAQVAVVPLLLLHFGSVPLLSPIANLLAAPLVTMATTLAGAGVLTGWNLPLQGAELAGGFVLQIARVAGQWPQLGLASVVATASFGLVMWKTRLRAITMMVGTIVTVVLVLPPGPPDVPTVVFLDVGQGDAVLLLDPSGSVALVDGGRDPAVIRDGLRRYGVGRIDLLIATHGDADHVGGLVGLASSVEIGQLWVPGHGDPSPLLEQLIFELVSSGIQVSPVESGIVARLGEFELETLGPSRRYAEPNDGSVVTLVRVDDRRILLPGDIGAVAQRTLPAMQLDVLMVPHHGSATTNPGWLKTSAAGVAVVSVGPNTYGHPDPAIVDALTSVGVEVLLTSEIGDIVLPLR